MQRVPVRRELGSCSQLLSRRRAFAEALSRGQAWLSDTEETKERAIPIKPASSRLSLGAAWSERGKRLFIRELVRKLDIQQRPGNIVPTGSDGGDRAARSTMASLASVFAF